MFQGLNWGNSQPRNDSGFKMESMFNLSMNGDELITWLRGKGLDVDDCEKIRSKLIFKL